MTHATIQMNLEDIPLVKEASHKIILSDSPSVRFLTHRDVELWVPGMGEGGVRT